MPKYKTIGSGILATKVRYKKSPGGKLYIGKSTFVNASYAENRAKALRQQGHKAWVEGRTVYVD